MRMRPYGYKPNPKFAGRDKHKIPRLYLGIELELHTKDDLSRNRALRALDAYPDIKKVFYAKSDSSLDGTQGVEFVSHPRTLGFWQKNMFKYMDVFKKTYETRIGYGLHVHVGRMFTKVMDDFGSRYVSHRSVHTVMKSLLSQYGEQLFTICGRSPTPYCRLKPIFDGVEESKSHYSWMALHHNTVEFRGGQATLDPYKALQYLELAESVMRYALYWQTTIFSKENELETNKITDIPVMYMVEDILNTPNSDELGEGFSNIMNAGYFEFVHTLAGYYPWLDQAMKTLIMQYNLKYETSTSKQKYMEVIKMKATNPFLMEGFQRVIRDYENRFMAESGMITRSNPFIISYNARINV